MRLVNIGTLTMSMENIFICPNKLFTHVLFRGAQSHRLSFVLKHGFFHVCELASKRVSLILDMPMFDFLKTPFLPLIRTLGKSIARRKFQEDPIFIGGCGRSGTTLLLSMLSAHGEVFACPRELGLFNHTHRDAEGRLVADRIDRLYRSFIFNPISRTAKRWCEKSPSNIHHIDEIDEYFDGKFKFIQMVRDGRDVVLSIHPTAPDRYWVKPQRWVCDVREGFAYKDHPQVKTVRYEDLITDYETTIRDLCQFLELPVSSEILHWHENAKVRRNSAYFSKVEKSHSMSIQKWKRTADTDRLADFMAEPYAKEWLSTLGYEV